MRIRNTRPAAERWWGGVVFGSGRRRSRPAPTSFAPMETAGDGARAPSGDRLRAGEGFGRRPVRWGLLERPVRGAGFGCGEGAGWAAGRGRWREALSMLGARAPVAVGGIAIIDSF